MIALPKPYPDEIFGSLLIRASIHYGMPLKRMLQSIHGKNRTSASFLMSSDLIKYENLIQVDAKKMLNENTMFPYAIAFMSNEEQEMAYKKILYPIKGEESISSITKNITHSLAYRKTCPLCIDDDLRTYGESYWHRSHLLPGVLICNKHNQPLHLTNINIRGVNVSTNNVLPQEAQSILQNNPTQEFILRKILEISLQALNFEISPSKNWPSIYRNLAIQKGYEMSHNFVSSRKFNLDFKELIDDFLLLEMGCALSIEQKNLWPSLMLRKNIGVPFAPTKHILLRTFFYCAQNSKRYTEYKKPGKKPKNYIELDKEAHSKISETLEKYKETEIRFTVEELLKEAKVYIQYRHNRSFFPKTNALITQFRFTNQAERQLGKREKWRKKHMKTKVIIKLNS